MSIYGVILMIGAAMGNTNPLHPLEFTYATNSASSSAIHKALSFQRIKTNDDFDHALQQAIAHHQITMLDFYADWCIACKEMEEFTFSNSDVQALLSSMQLLKADVTANDLQDKRLMERFNVLAPPTLLFFDKQGNEIPSLRIIGYLSPEQFLQKLAEI